MTTAIAGILLTFGPQSPADVIQAFGVALKKHDFPAMARLVVGGKPDYPFANLMGDMQEIDQVYASVKIVVKKVEISSSKCTATINRALQDRNQNGSVGDEKVRLELENGTWKIVPHGKQGVTGYFIETYADYLAMPEETEKYLKEYRWPTRNRTPEAEKLGKARSTFLSKVLDGRHGYGTIPYTGYISMTMVQHTAVVWPINRSDEMIFLYTSDSPPLLTKWSLVSGKPRRLWQVTLESGKMKTQTGTLAKWLSSYEVTLPKRAPADLTRTLNKVQAYAAYREQGAISVFNCWVILPDGSQVCEGKKLNSMSIGQDTYQAFHRGFFVTPDERSRIPHMR